MPQSEVFQIGSQQHDAVAVLQSEQRGAVIHRIFFFRF